MHLSFCRWLNKNLRGRKGQQGFTLIELLVVVTILGILAGIVTLGLVGITTHANVQACQGEYKTVQAALDAYLADQTAITGSTVVTISTPANPTNDMTSPVLLYTTAPTAAQPNYTRNGKTQFYYMWDGYGRITAIYSANVASPSNLITGCAPI